MIYRALQYCQLRAAFAFDDRTTRQLGNTNAHRTHWPRSPGRFPWEHRPAACNLQEWRVIARRSNTSSGVGTW